MRQAAHAVLLVLLDHRPFGLADKDHGIIGGAQRIGEACADPATRAIAIGGRDPEVLAAHARVELDGVFARRHSRVRNLTFGPRFQAAQERVAHRRGIEPGGRELVQQHVARFDLAKRILPPLRDRAFLGQQRPRAELEGDAAQFGVVDPVVPFAQEPHSAGHDDRHAIGKAFCAHRFAQCLHARIGVLGFARVLGVGQAVVPAGQPRIFVDHRRHQV